MRVRRREMWKALLRPVDVGDEEELCEGAMEALRPRLRNGRDRALVRDAMRMRRMWVMANWKKVVVTGYGNLYTPAVAWMSAK